MSNWKWADHEYVNLDRYDSIDVDFISECDRWEVRAYYKDLNGRTSHKILFFCYKKTDCEKWMHKLMKE